MSGVLFVPSGVHLLVYHASTSHEQNQVIKTGVMNEDIHLPMTRTPCLHLKDVGIASSTGISLVGAVRQVKEWLDLTRAYMTANPTWPRIKESLSAMWASMLGGVWFVSACHRPGRWRAPGCMTSCHNCQCGDHNRWSLIWIVQRVTLLWLDVEEDCSDASLFFSYFDNRWQDY
jgi:hypothetical protein